MRSHSLSVVKLLQPKCPPVNEWIKKLWYIYTMFLKYYFHLSFFLFLWHIMFIYLRILYHPCIPGMHSTWSWCVIFSMYFWIRFANILWRILASVFISDIGLYFAFFVVSLSSLGLGWCCPHKKSLGVFCLLGLFGIVWEE